MKDFLEKYHKREQKTTGLIVAGALLMAVAFNFLALDNTNLASNIKTSIIDSGNKSELSDIYLEKNDNSIKIVNSKQIENLSSLSLSLAFNPEEISIETITSDYGSVETLGATEDGIITIIITTEKETLENRSNILTISYEKSTDNSSQVNSFNANFTEKTGDMYELTTSGVTL